MNAVHRPAWRLFLVALAGLFLTAPALAANSGVFLENIGQFDDAVAYRTHIGATVVWFTNDGIVLDLVDPATFDVMQAAGESPDLLSPSLDKKLMRRRGCVVKIRFDASTPGTLTQGRHALTGRTNYLLGNDASEWRTGVRSFTEILHEDVWPGIDLLWRVAPGRLEYEALLSPGAVPSDIRFAYEGAEIVNADADGVRIGTSVGTIVHHLPASGDTGGAIVVGESSGSSTVPRNYWAMDWCTFVGGSGYEWGTGIAVDDQGRPVIVGWTTSVDFPVTVGAYDVTLDDSLGPYSDAFVTKLDATGTTLIWSTYLGGALDEEAVDVVLDSAGNAIVAGRTVSADFPTTTGAFDETASTPIDDWDVFVTKLSEDGTSLEWSSYLGKGRDDRPFDLALSSPPDEAVVVVGETLSPAFPTTPGAYKLTHSGTPYGDAFITKFSPAGDSLIWSTLHGADDANDRAFSVALDAQENPVVAGGTWSPNFVTTPGAYDQSYSGSGDGFLTKISATGASLVWSTFLGGSFVDVMFGVAIQGAGDVVATGRTRSTDFPTTPGAFDETFNPPSMDAVVARLSADGSSLIWSTYLGGTTSGTTFYPGNYVTDVEIGPLDSPIVVGLTTCADFPTTPDAFQPTFAGGRGDGFITVLKNDGSKLVWSTFCGGTNDPVVDGFGADGEAEPIALSDGNLYIVGVTEASDFPVSPEGTVWDSSWNGSTDATVVMIPFPTVAAPEIPAATTDRLQLACSPNPFRGVTEIRYSLPVASAVEITVHEVGGRLVRTLGGTERATAGPHRVSWDGRDDTGLLAAGGVYFVRVKTADREESERVVLLR